MWIGLAIVAGCRSPGRGRPGAAPTTIAGEVVSFRSGDLVLHGVLHRPPGAGPFPAVLYNHGSAPGMLPIDAANVLGPLYAGRGWIFFMPCRRGQCLSAGSGRYIDDEIEAARKTGGPAAAQATMARLLETEQLADQMAGLAWLRASGLADVDRIAVAGNSFGGIETVLAAEHDRGLCAAVDSAGGAATWAGAPALRALMVRAVENARAPILFFQAENDYDLAPSRTLSAAMKTAGKPFELRIFPPFGRSTIQGHTFGYFGGEIWGPEVFRFLDAHCPARPR
jgi:dipeptidyl aminopeptidase/acylaminoacyl peptidase